MITLGTTIDDAPAEYSDGRSVRNASGKYRGMTTVREAIEDSLNIPAVKVLPGNRCGQGMGIASKLWIHPSKR